MSEEIQGWSRFITKSYREDNKYGFPVFDKIATYELIELVKRDKPKNNVTILFKKQNLEDRIKQRIKQCEEIRERRMEKKGNQKQLYRTAVKYKGMITAFNEVLGLIKEAKA